MPTRRFSLRRRPAHQIVDALILDLHEAETMVETHRRVEFFHIDGHRLAGAPGLVEQVAEQRRAQSAAAMLWQERYVHDVVLALPAMEIETAGRRTAALDQQ